MTTLCRNFACLQVLVLAILFVHGAVARQASGDTVYRSRANAVLVPTLVTDAEGKVVYGMRAGDFVVEDDGIAQAIHLDEYPDAQPISLLIAIQVGRRARHEFERMAGLSSMLDPVLKAPNTEAAVLFFDSQLNLAEEFTKDSERIEESLTDLHGGDGGAAILDAVAYSARLLNKRPEGRQRVLLLISETRDHGSHLAQLDEVVRLIGATNTSVYALTFSPYVSEQLDVLRGNNVEERQSTVDLLAKLVELRNALKRNIPNTLASITGGECDLFETQKSFEARMVGFTNHLNSRYQLSFAPKSPHAGLHEIRVRLKEAGEGRNVVFRKSYFVEESP